MTQEHTYGLSEAQVLLIKSNYRNQIQFGDSCIWSLASETTALYFQALLFFNIIPIIYYVQKWLNVVLRFIQVQTGALQPDVKQL